MAEAISDDSTVAVPLLVIREAASMPRIAEIHHDEVLSHVLPAFPDLIRHARTRGLIRDVDLDLAARTRVRPIIAHVLMARVFEMRPKVGLRIHRLVADHLNTVFEGLNPRKEVG